MILHPFNETPVISMTRFREDAEFLEQALAAEGIQVPAASPLADAIDVAKRVASRERLSAAPRAIGKAAGLSYLVRLIAETVRRGQLSQIQGHLRYLADARANPLPTTRADPLQPRNMVFELEVGCLAACCGLHIELADEPDVHISSSPTWDIACKAITSGNPVTLGDRIEEGIGQVLRFNGVYGIVALGLINRVTHDALMPLICPDEDIWGSFISFPAAVQALQVELKRTVADIRQQAVTRFTDGRNPKFRGILLVVHSACAVGGTAALLSSAGLVQRHDLYDLPPLEGPELKLSERLNAVAHATFWG
jgi:hypothetical protein